MPLNGRQDFENCLCWLPEMDTNYFGFPEIKGVKTIPEGTNFINSEFARRGKDYDSWVMFYEYDYKFTRMWEQPKRQAKWLSNFAGAITPNFSVYNNIPLALNIYSIYRARWCGAYWESLGIKVIPDVSWGDKNTWDFCFDGLPHNSIVAINDIGKKSDIDKLTRGLWIEGFCKMISVLTPVKVLVKGSKMDDIPQDTPLIYI